MPTSTTCKGMLAWRAAKGKEIPYKPHPFNFHAFVCWGKILGESSILFFRCIQLYFINETFSKQPILLPISPIPLPYEISGDRLRKTNNGFLVFTESNPSIMKFQLQAYPCLLFKLLPSCGDYGLILTKKIVF